MTHIASDDQADVSYLDAARLDVSAPRDERVVFALARTLTSLDAPGIPPGRRARILAPTHHPFESLSQRRFGSRCRIARRLLCHRASDSCSNLQLEFAQTIARAPAYLCMPACATLTSTPTRPSPPHHESGISRSVDLPHQQAFIAQALRRCRVISPVIGYEAISRVGERSRLPIPWLACFH
jgi:hypothetical protein